MTTDCNIGSLHWISALRTEKKGTSNSYVQQRKQCTIVASFSGPKKGYWCKKLKKLGGKNVHISIVCYFLIKQLQLWFAKYNLIHIMIQLNNILLTACEDEYSKGFRLKFSSMPPSQSPSPPSSMSWSSSASCDKVSNSIFKLQIFFKLSSYLLIPRE